MWIHLRSKKEHRSTIESCQIPKQSIWPTVSYFKTFFALPALAPKCLDSQKFSFNLFCRKEQELFVEYFRFFIAQKMKELQWFLCNFFFKKFEIYHFPSRLFLSRRLSLQDIWTYRNFLLIYFVEKSKGFQWNILDFS